MNTLAYLIAGDGAFGGIVDVLCVVVVIVVLLWVLRQFVERL